VKPDHQTCWANRREPQPSLQHDFAS